ncbi:MAG: thiamine diphosphokinase [Rubellimicrobium sp.]|nr:thiamine diphosphokinase [Rubellimicrobium sp.]
MIVDSLEPVTLVGGGDLTPGDLTTALSLAPILVAADGGAGSVMAAGLAPCAVIGDMDSIPPEAAAAFAAQMHPIAEQETTDFDKALRHVLAPLVIAVGFSGGRFDHELAVLHTLVRRAERPCLVLGRESITFLCPPTLSLDLAPGEVVSLFPMGSVAVASEGLRWPTGGLEFAPERLIGTSNEALGPVRLEAGAPRMLVILPRHTLTRTVAALASVSAGWPAL